MYTKGGILKSKFRHEELFDTWKACSPALQNVDVSNLADITLIHAGFRK